MCDDCMSLFGNVSLDGLWLTTQPSATRPLFEGKVWVHNLGYDSLKSVSRERRHDRTLVPTFKIFDWGHKVITKRISIHKKINAWQSKQACYHGFVSSCRVYAPHWVPKRKGLFDLPKSSFGEQRGVKLQRLQKMASRQSERRMACHDWHRRSGGQVR